MSTGKYNTQREKAELVFSNMTSKTSLTIYGSVNCSAALLFWTVNLLYLKVILKVEAMEKSLYILSIINAIFDMIQLVSHFYSGVVLILGKKHEAEHIDQIFGAFLSSSWMQMTLNITHFTIIRLLIIVSPTAIKKIYKKPLMVILPSTVVFIILLLLEGSPLAAFNFDLKSFSWFFDEERILSNVLDYMDIVLTITYLSVTAVSYSIIAFKLLVNIGGRRETIITMQVLLYCIYTSFTFVFWVFIDPVVVFTPPFLFMSNFLWIIWNGLSPTLEIIFNE
ncbi:hypothetical protein RB195_000062 [Necator americanus]|uniref:7TM GPCR serpentine receptor class x (Srx) domain-containing protein n=1 Tax=Necator americanus TaxID=51031 RepID=A0ABR1D8M1_NECAM